MCYQCINRSKYDKAIVSKVAGSWPMVPHVVNHGQRGEKSYDVYSRLLTERIIYAMGPVSGLTIHNNILLIVKAL